MRSMYRASRIFATLLVGTSLAAGCGGDDDDGGGDVSTGIAPNRLLSDVSAEEAAQACENLAAGFDARLSPEMLVRSICTLLGAAVADTPEDCETARDECIAQADDPSSAQGQELDVDSIQFECDAEGGADLRECTSTAGELETCFNDLLDQISLALNAVSCDDAATVTEEDAGGLQESTFEPPASCELIDCGESGPFGPAED